MRFQAACLYSLSFHDAQADLSAVLLASLCHMAALRWLSPIATTNDDSPKLFPCSLGWHTGCSPMLLPLWALGRGGAPCLPQLDPPLSYLSYYFCCHHCCLKISASVLTLQTSLVAYCQ